MFLAHSSLTAITDTAEITIKLKAAEPTIVEGPSSPAGLPRFWTVSMTESRISGALEPRAMSVRFASVGFQTFAVTVVVSSAGEQKLTRDGVHFRNLSRRGGNNFDGAHENVRHDRNAQEQPQQAQQVEEAEEPIVDENNAWDEDPAVANDFGIIKNDHFSSRKFKIISALVVVPVVFKGIAFTLSYN